LAVLVLALYWPERAVAVVRMSDRKLIQSLMARFWVEFINQAMVEGAQTIVAPPARCRQRKGSKLPTDAPPTRNPLDQGDHRSGNQCHMNL
jgi:hypothetical protein